MDPNPVLPCIPAPQRSCWYGQWQSHMHLFRYQHQGMLSSFGPSTIVVSVTLGITGVSISGDSESCHPLGFQVLLTTQGLGHDRLRTFRQGIILQGKSCRKEAEAILVQGVLDQIAIFCKELS